MRNPKKKRVAIIGAGWSGLMAIKILKEEYDTFEPVCFEATEDYGGTWRYREEDVEGVASVMSTTVINHSKEMGSISDFPPPAEFPNYMPHYMLLQYWTEFARNNDCFRHIRYSHEVVRVQQTPDYSETGHWNVTVKNKTNGEVFTDEYDAVFICVGHSTYPNIPKLRGMEKFKGKIIHSHSLKKADDFKNQRVAVIGVGCSGLDASVETSSVAKQVYLSTRCGAWILPRLGPYGLPFDYTFLRRWIFFFVHYLPVDFVSTLLEKTILTTKFSHGLYGLKPNHHVLAQDPAISDVIPYKLLTGAVLLRGDVRTFTENGIIFDGESVETKLDSVVLATGYTWKIPFLSDDIITRTGSRINLYKCVFPAQLKHPTLALIGFVQPLGPGFPFGEMQCRWVVQLLLGNTKLPSPEAMLEEIASSHEKNSRRYLPSDTLTVHVDYIPYLDDIASRIGAKPNLLKMAFSDPKLLLTLAFGPSLPFQYRLQGPHPWRYARQAILTSKDRVKAPLRRGKSVKFCESKPTNTIYYYAFIIIVLWWLSVINITLK